MLENQYYEYGMQTPEIQMQRRPQQEREELQKVLGISSPISTVISRSRRSASFSALTKKQVERWFQAYKGMTYYQYVKELRLKKVCFYLRFTELQMKEIAVRVGFSSAQNLARFFFRRRSGCPCRLSAGNRCGNAKTIGSSRPYAAAIRPESRKDTTKNGWMVIKN